MKKLLFILTLSFGWCLPAHAQSTAQPIQLGFLSTTGCVGKQQTCFIPYSNANPMPVSGAGGGSGTVTSVSVATANGFSGTVANPTTTPAITIIAGAITPTSVNGNTITTGSGILTLAASKTLTASNTLTLTGTDGSSVDFGAGGTVLYSVPASSTINLGISASATNPQRSGQAGTGLYSDTTNQVGIAANSNPVIKLTGIASAVDYLTITNAATANPGVLQITASGSDTNKSIAIMPSGTGSVGIGTTSPATTWGATISNQGQSQNQLKLDSAGGRYLGIDFYSGATRYADFQYDTVGNVFTFAAIHSGAAMNFQSSVGIQFMYADSSQNVIIGPGTTPTAGALLTVSGTAALTGIASDATHTDTTVCQDTTSHVLYSGSGTLGICLGTSSIRYKNNVTLLDDGLSQINSLKPVNFYYNKGHGDNGGREQYGFIAEDFVKVLPKLTQLDKDGKPNSVDILGVVPILVKAIQEQQAEIESLQSQIKGLKK